MGGEVVGGLGVLRDGGVGEEKVDGGQAIGELAELGKGVDVGEEGVERWNGVINRKNCRLRFVTLVFFLFFFCKEQS